jgi:hypothetical protein
LLLNNFTESINLLNLFVENFKSEIISGGDFFFLGGGALCSVDLQLGSVIVNNQLEVQCFFRISSSVALQSGVGLGLLYNTPPSLSIPSSVTPFVYSHFFVYIYSNSLHVSSTPVFITRRINYINPLKNKRRLLHLKTQFVPRCKHFSSRL